MKRFLARYATWRSIGLLVGDRQLHLCVMAATPLGRVELARVVEDRGEGSLDQAIQRVLEPWLKLKPGRGWCWACPRSASSMRLEG